MNWLSRLLTAKKASQSNLDIMRAGDAFEAGKGIWNDVVLHRPSAKSDEDRTKQALKLFDEAIEKGYDAAEVYSLRGSCLNQLGFYTDAIEDYDKAIERYPNKAVAANYHMRSVIKDSLGDLEGSVADLKEAVRLSRKVNADNAYWDNHWKKMGFRSATDFYESCLEDEERLLAYKRRSPEMFADKNAKSEVRRSSK